MRIIYMGTPEFAVSALQSIVQAGHEVVAVVTQPDKPQGRSKKLVAPPVKIQAQEYEIPVYQPEKLREASMVEILRGYQPDMIVVAAYGQILSEEILAIPPYGCINIHASLLPKYRGAAPIEWSIINGEQVTGVTTMYMEKGLDTGDMIEKTEVVIEPEDTGATLHDKLAEAGARLILTTIEKLQSHAATRTKQDDAQSCYASMLRKDMGCLDFTKDATVLERLIRGLIPWPCAYTNIQGKQTKIYQAEVVYVDEAYRHSCMDRSADLKFLPGEVVEVTKKSFVVACGVDALRIKRLQPQGKKEMDAAAFLNGNALQTGNIIGE